MKKENTLKCMIFLIFAGLLFCMRIPVTYIADDAMVAPTITDQTLLENFIAHWTDNGRIFTDVLANIFYRMPIIVWKIFDTGVYCLIAGLITKLFTKNTWKDLLIVCILLFLFPFSYMASAGYIATSANYIYPVLCLLVILLPITNVQQGKPVSKPMYVAAVISVLYATNHDQTAMVLFGGLLLYLIYNIVTKAEQKIIRTSAIWFCFSLASYIFMFLMPGHIARMSSTFEIDYWLPQYVDWTLFDKIYHGFTTTMATLLYHNVELFLLLCFMLLLVALRQNSIRNKIIAVIPLIIIFIGRFIGTGNFIVYYDYACNMPELLPYTETILPLALAILAVVCIFYTIWTCVSSLERKCLLTMLMILAAGSREMMGFSATIYASSFRTFTFFLFACIACILVLLNELQEESEHKEFYYMGIGAIVFMFFY